jgi:hypothetical protein
MGYSGGVLAPLYQPELVEVAMFDMVHDGVRATMQFAVEYTPINENPFSSPGRKPGSLADAWRLRPDLIPGTRRGNKTLTAEYENPDPIAPFVENDTRPHLIKPRLDRRPASVVATKRPRRMGDDPQAALTWLTIGGVRVFARVVKHPGTTGHHMTTRAAARAEAEFPHLMRPALEKWRKRAIRQGMKNQPKVKIPGGF